MKRYESYKDSGVEWLGEVPSHWELGRINTFFTERRVKVSDKDYPALSVTKLGVFPQWENVAKTNDGDNRKLVKKGDFVINSRSDRKGSSGIAKQDGSVSLINIVLKPKRINPIYSEYLFKSYNFIEEFYRVGHGIVADLWTTRFEDIKNSLIALPPLEEQQKIANYLDDKTTKIERAISLAEKQTELLKEHKQILIQSAVTKGLDSNVEMKDSGVEWIGEVPAHWEVKKLKFVLVLSNNKEESKNSDKRYIGMENVESFTGKINDTILSAEGVANSFYKNEILFGKLRPYLTKSYLADFDGVCSTEFLVYKTTQNMNNHFALSIFLSHGFINTVNSSTYGSKMPRANSEFLSNMLLPIPPLEEQQQIAQYLYDKTAKIDYAISLKQQHIEKLKEYKSVLINDVVTGKVRV
ncbi:restriction endonuclease subunit S [Rodentibacter caecimuris]|uniref:restriction endonuclease subunit S n=1 Tax=Rodentibacter caecimuris TaxID=1796644 RepID=UPI00258EF66B|nr:restriction endonuclease subunit S [Rodentibacter heylii]